jgi:hypothetical protein
MHISLAVLLFYTTNTTATLTWPSCLNPKVQKPAVAPLGQYVLGDNWGPEDPCCCDWQLCRPAPQNCVKTCGSLYGADW